MILPDDIFELISVDRATLRVTSREGKHCEFKESFERESLPRYMKALSAFANADGGKIIFGVSDAPRLVVGVDLNSILDDADIANQLSTYFDPEIPIQSKEYTINGLSLFVLSTPCSAKRPVICKRGKNVEIVKRGATKTKELLAEGAIYYRYSAKSERIKYTELQGIIEDREQKKIQSIIETLKLAEKVGFEKLGFVDAKDFGQEGKATDLYVTEQAAKSLNFIDEGRFVEKSDDGSPAYYVMGKVNLRQVVVGVLPDEDKNLPNEVATLIRPDVHARYGNHVAISSGQVGKILSAFELNEMPHSQEDAKLARRYITRVGIEEILASMNREPERFLRSFSSKPNIARFMEESR